MSTTLIIGYGNPDREDDGVAWHIVAQLAERIGRSDPVLDALPDVDSTHLDGPETSPDLLCLLQLTPEIAEVIARYDSVCFVDAHTGELPEAIRFQPVEACFQASPFTHHLTPETCLSMAEILYGQRPSAHVLSVRGYQFGFSQQLSPMTEALAGLAVDQVLAWLQSSSTGNNTVDLVSRAGVQHDPVIHRR